MPSLETQSRPKPKFVDKEWLRLMMDEHDTRSGFVPMPGATAELAQQLVAADLRERGIDPEERIFSRGIVEMREE